MTRLSIALMVFLFMVTLVQSAAEPAGDDAGGNLASAKQLDSRLTAYQSHPTVVEQSGNSYEFRFVYEGDSAELLGVATPHAMRIAAAIYAIQTGKAAVTVRDVVDSGYWPFITFGPDFDYGQAVSATHAQIILPEALVTEVGSDDWALGVKDYILTAFYNEYYYFGSLGTSDEKPGLLPVPPSELQPTPAFWISPLTGNDFEYGEAKGYIHECPMTWYIVGPQCRLDQETTSSSILLLVNTRDLFPTPTRSNGRTSAADPQT